MKTIILFVFFASLFYYLRPTDKPIVVDLDEIRVKVSAPQRHERPHVHRIPSNVIPQSDEEAISEVASNMMEKNMVIEEEWEGSLRERLLELDPVAGEEIFQIYKKEKDTYAQKLEYLVRNHQESEDLDFLIDGLDFEHQQRLQDIFGPYFEDLQDLQLSINQ